MPQLIGTNVPINIDTHKRFSVYIQIFTIFGYKTLKNSETEGYGEFSKNKAIWKFIEFGNKLKSWKRFRRCIFTKLTLDQRGQYLLDLARPDSAISTNIGMCKEADDKLLAAGGEKYFEAETIISLTHERGADELIHRSIKELATKEQVPFQSFGMNRAYYYLPVIVHFMFECYKRDITPDVIPVTAYPNIPTHSEEN